MTPTTNPKKRKMGNNDIFNHIIEMNTDVERRKMAANAMYAMLSNSTYAKTFRVTKIAELAVNVTDALIMELNKKK